MLCYIFIYNSENDTHLVCQFVCWEIQPDLEQLVPYWSLTC